MRNLPSYVSEARLKIGHLSHAKQARALAAMIEAYVPWTLAERDWSGPRAINETVPDTLRCAS